MYASVRWCFLWLVVVAAPCNCGINDVGFWREEDTATWWNRPTGDEEESQDSWTSEGDEDVGPSDGAEEGRSLRWRGPLRDEKGSSGGRSRVQEESALVVRVLGAAASKKLLNSSAPTQHLTRHNNIIDMLGKMIPQSCWYRGDQFECGLSLSCVLEGGRPLDLCSGGMIWSCCVPNEKYQASSDPNIGAIENATIQFIQQLQQQQQDHNNQEETQEQDHHPQNGEQEGAAASHHFWNHRPPPPPPPQPPYYPNFPHSYRPPPPPPPLPPIPPSPPPPPFTLRPPDHNHHHRPPPHHHHHHPLFTQHQFPPLSPTSSPPPPPSYQDNQIAYRGMPSQKRARLEHNVGSHVVTQILHERRGIRHRDDDHVVKHGDMV